jgi:hypothetical protein
LRAAVLPCVAGQHDDVRPSVWQDDTGQGRLEDRGVRYSIEWGIVMAVIFLATVAVVFD